MIRVPEHMAKTARKVHRARSKLQQHGREPGSDEIAARSGIAKAHVEQALSLVQDPTSLDIPIGEDGDTTLGDLLEAPDADNPHTAAEAAALRDCVAMRCFFAPSTIRSDVSNQDFHAPPPPQKAHKRDNSKYWCPGADYVNLAKPMT